jgi:hypothetical protein
MLHRCRIGVNRSASRPKAMEGGARVRGDFDVDFILDDGPPHPCHGAAAG